ncbi:MAG: zinc ribbon domain-containing protein [Microbacteriaceae bacterium]
MKATPQIQQLLLLVANLDLDIARLEVEKASILAGSQVDKLRSELTEASERLLAARVIEENLELEIRKTASDLDSVEKRIAHDKTLLAQSSSTREIDGIESELRSLAARQSDLEDAELALLDQLEAAKTSRETAEAARKNAASLLEELESKNQADLVKLSSGLDVTRHERANKAAELPTELFERYEKLQSRGTGAANLIGRECGACRLALTAAAYDEVVGTASDELPSCPNCQALLIR